MRDGHAPGQSNDHASPWYATLWLTGVDYFSSLGYAPGLAILASGYVAPLATLLLVLVTFFAAVPVYWMVAKHSSDGEGSIKMVERLTARWGRLGWAGKMTVLALLGFAMTDFVITITLSAADATHHLVENPLIAWVLPESPVVVTALLILGLCAVFLKGFREAIGVAVAVAVPYMVLNAVIIGGGLTELANDPAPISDWTSRILNFETGELASEIALMDAEGSHDFDGLPPSGMAALVAVSLLVFPKLALGMSGFETGVAVMPNIKAGDRAGRIANTHKMLVAAALLMCVELTGANLVSTLVIPPEAFHPHDGHAGEASGRALAWLAHHLYGPIFGTIYDINTVLILWFAGTSAMAGLLNLLPRYLPRFGMSPGWLEYRRPLVLLLTGVCLTVNYLFDANVEAQGGAYATGVLVLMASGAFAVLLAEWEHPRLRLLFGLILAVFVYVLVVNVVERPDGIKIAATFIVLTLLASLWSRYLRASELRVPAMNFQDAESERMWREIKDSADVVLIPLRSADPSARIACAARKIQHHQTPVSRHVFLHVNLLEDTSQFQSPLRVKVTRHGDDHVIEVSDAVAVANAIAYVAIELDVREVVIGLLDNGTPVMNALMYLLFGTGEVGYGVRAIFMRVREDWLAEHRVRLKQFDVERDKVEEDLLRDMVVLETDEREKRADDMFEHEKDRFRASIPTLRRLPHLILFE